MAKPFFSICIPQYNRTSFLLEACQTLSNQTFKDFEICISDDCSTDGRANELQEFLRASGLRFVFRAQKKNRRYDGNLRESISLASGEWCLLMGNDDCMAESTTLDRLHTLLSRYAHVGVAVTNYAEYGGGRVYRRVAKTGIAGRGAQVAIGRFRNFSFVSGVMFRRDLAQAYATDKWDGSEMYQMYIACRILTDGYELLELEQIAVLKSLMIAGESVDSYAAKARLVPCPIMERSIPLVQMGRLVYDAVASGATVGTNDGLKIFLQILLFTYPFWILEYRRVQSWNYALGICVGMRPRRVLMRVPLGVSGKLLLRTAYFLVTLAGLFAPIPLFDFCRPRLHSFAKSRFQSA